MRLPRLSGDAIEIAFLPALRSRRGKLLPGHRDGVEIHAASFVRRRRIVFDTALLRRPRELERIFVHELFHFAWVRLGNAGRRAYEEIVAAEIRHGILGETGWSAESRKVRLDGQTARRRTRRWREYVCESFCDTAACLLGPSRRPKECTLSAGAIEARRRWFTAAGFMRRIPV
ncbi:MAG: hypothetical protein ACRD96_23755 [Bryobacteraceae bacterium]